MLAKVNIELICDVNLLIFLNYLLPMLKIVHAFIKFTKKKDVFVCDYVAIIFFVKVNFILTMWIQQQNMFMIILKTSKA